METYHRLCFFEIKTHSISQKILCLCLMIRKELGWGGGGGWGGERYTNLSVPFYIVY